ncbi:MAG: rhodanese-like domain-containing protein [Gammaproteobacteria bacterium]|nr:MAG: rhodanese-like domain-containing protein [Gammaproteobacteria bacterium]
MDQYLVFATNHWELHLALAAVLGMIVWSFIGNHFAGYRHIDPQGAVPLINREGGVVVDIRETKEFKEGHIVDALHIPINNLEKRHVELNRYKDKPIIVTCHSGARSSGACSTLRKAGFEHVYMMRGGMLSWKSASLPVVRKKK